MTSATKYDRIGRGYAHTRRTDPRIMAHVEHALGDAARVCNVGAGTGSYEPPRRAVIAVEPSPTMIGQRPAGAASVVRGVAEALPFADSTFDAALAVLTVHHWQDLAAGCAEIRRVAGRQVVLYFEPTWVTDLWLIDDYFPEIRDLPTERRAPSIVQLAQHLRVERFEPVPVPADCVDGFAGCYWNRPDAYLDPVVQDGMSCFAQLDDDARARGTERLRADLESGAWDARYGHLRALAEYDLGYRILVAVT